MLLKRTDEPTVEQINRAIFLLVIGGVCYHDVRKFVNFSDGVRPYYKCTHCGKESLFDFSSKNYCRSHDAVHDAEYEAMNKYGRKSYAIALAEQLGYETSTDWDEVGAMITADPRIRAETVLKMYGINPKQEIE